MVSFAFADGEIYWEAMRRNTEDGEGRSGVFTQYQQHRSDSEYIILTEEEKKDVNIILLSSGMTKQRLF